MTLFCETAAEGPAAHDDLVVLAAQLRALGIGAAVAAGSAPPELSRGAMLDLVPLATGAGPREGDRLLLLRGHEGGDAALARLRRLALPPAIPTTVWGNVPTLQAEIGIRTRLSYVLGADPEVAHQPPGLGAGQHHIPVFGVPGPRAPRRDAAPAVLLVAPPLAAEAQAQALVALAASPCIRPVLLCDGAAKDAWTARMGQVVAAWHATEALPDALAAQADLAVLFAPPTASYRSQALLANLVVRGVPVADASPGWAHLAAGAPFLQGPGDLLALPAFLAGGILDGLPELGARIARSRFADALRPPPAVEALRDPGPATPPPDAPVAATGRRRPLIRAAARQTAPSPDATPGAPPIVVVPTNGVGLGHAQRCTLVAGDLARAGVAPTFAAFPSCLRLIRSRGFDAVPLVSRSALHLHDHENDLVNHLRLGALTRGARALVFDGGYVFDSIFRTVVDNRLAGVWIRRGLWQAGQSNGVALDREKAFRRVIVPLEAFEELNAAYSRGAHVAEVGPIVQRLDLGPDAREGARDALRARYGHAFRHLVVTMLGGGVAADRSAQIASICATMAARPDTLHLVVVWPTATVEAGAFAWPNTRVVRTHHAAPLVACADLFLSAVGYNSFHEALYNRVPTVFMAQMNAFMDDQRRRAQAAVDRGLADLVEPTELAALARLVAAHLDGGRADDLRGRLQDLALPEPGTADAARLILETAECPIPAGRPSWPASPATSPTISTIFSPPSIPAPPPGRAATSFPTVPA